MSGFSSSLYHSDSFITDSPSASISTPTSSLAVRRLEISHGSTRFTISISQSLYSPALALRTSFLSNILKPEPEAQWSDEPTTGGELLARFLNYLLLQIEQDFLDYHNGPHAKILSLCLDKFEDAYLRGNDIHALVASWPTAPVNRRTTIRAYIRSRHTLERPPLTSRSSLLRMCQQETAKVYAIFGGQGSNENYFNELRELYTTYRPIVQALIAASSGMFQRLARAFPEHYLQGFDLLHWLEDRDSQPESGYLINAPISFPLIGLIQLCHLAVMFRGLGIGPGNAQKLCLGTTGHSQGILIAAVIAVADSMESFEKVSAEALSTLLFIGCRCHEIFPPVSVDHHLVSDSEEHGEGYPTPMLSIRDLSQEKLQAAVDSVNQYLPPGRQIRISLVNGYQNFVVTGPRTSLVGLNVCLRGLKAPSGLNQDRVPFNERKPTFSTRFLPVTAPFHNPLLAAAVDLVVNDLQDNAISLFADDLRIPLYSTVDGTDLRGRGAQNILPEIVRMIVTDPLNWNRATDFPGATHVLDFGPGGTAGVGVMTNKIKQGCGVRVILASLLEGSNADVGYKPELYASNIKHNTGMMWGTQFKPTLVRTHAGKTIISTKMSRLLGLPPIMVAGMTPTTVSWEFVAATMKAGYHIELASGGYHDADELSLAIHRLVDDIPAGRGITINVIYASPHALRWQIPLLTKLRAEGIPIEGLTLGAGVPSLDIANGYIQDMNLKFISFKPSSISSIQNVVEIARANPDFPIMLQWTGGRGGGHHSFEAFHPAILEMYGTVRGCQNIILVAGSGLGGADDSYEYMSGDWSTRFGYPKMPFDGVLFGSRCMVAQEAKTSLEAKQAIVDARGVDDEDWVKTYREAAGGVITVVSEMGEPIHKLATRGVKLWAEFDKTIFNITDKTKRVEAINKKRDYIIKRLNEDFAKPWFGRCPHTGQPIEFEEMTYSSIIDRFLHLTYIEDEKRWVHPSFKQLLQEFIVQAESRFVGTRTQRPTGLADLDTPFSATEAIYKTYPAMRKQVIIYQDVQFFIALCRRRGQKPVPFIPILDENFETWFKKDSLWQSEDIKAVIGQDVGRVCILQGPVAVKYSTRVDEPIQEILDNVHQGHIKHLVAELYCGEVSRIPRVDCFGLPEEIELDQSYIKEHGNIIQFEVPTETDVDLPDLEAWLSALGGPVNNWRRAFFTTKTIIAGKDVQQNPVRRLFTPTRGALVTVDTSGNAHAAIVSLWETRDTGEPIKVVEVRAVKHNVIALEMMDARGLGQRPVTLALWFDYHADASWAPIRESLDGKSDRIKGFYHKLWFGEPVAPGLSIDGDFTSNHEVVAHQTITRFARCIGNFDGSYRKLSDEKLQAPLDYAIVVAWKAIMRPLFGQELDADLLRLVHLSNSFRMINGARPIREGDVLSTKSKITAIVNTATGKRIEVDGTIYRDGERIIKVCSAFFIRGSYTNYDQTFERIKEVPYEVHIQSKKDLAVLREKKWFHLHDKSRDVLGAKLIFKVHTTVRFEDRDVFRQVKVAGLVFLATGQQEIEVGIVALKAGRGRANPVMDYLRRHGTRADGRVYFENPYPLSQDGPSIVRTPASNEAYAAVSGDFNPIHVSRPVMAYIQLRGTITHGMYTSAMVRGILEKFVCPSQVELFKAFKCSFVGMVLPSDELEIHFHHIGMHEGRKIIKVEAKQKQTGSPVLLGEAEVEPPSTAYVFTGQGSQQRGMGMDLYEKSPAARKVWDFADNFFLETYGRHRLLTLS